MVPSFRPRATSDRRRSVRLLYAVLAVAVLAGVAACGSDNPKRQGPPLPTTPAAGQGVKTDAEGFPVEICNLVSKEMVESVFNVKIATTKQEKVSCSYATADNATATFGYQFRVYPGVQTYADFADSTKHPGFKKVYGPWSDAVYYQDFGGGLTFAFKTAKWTAASSASGSKIIDNAEMLTKLTTLATALSQALNA